MGTSAIDDLLQRCRERIDRWTPAEAEAARAAGALLVDIRPSEQRRADGEVPGAIVVRRDVLEWRLDPTSPHRIPEATDPNRPVILLCAEGYSTSLAAATLQELGLTRAGEVIGGFLAWRAAGLPVRRPEEDAAAGS